MRPLTFIVYSEVIILAAVLYEVAVIKVNGININNVRLADDNATLAENLEDLLILLHKVVKKCEEICLTLRI